MRLLEDSVAQGFVAAGKVRSGRFVTRLDEEEEAKHTCSVATAIVEKHPHMDSIPFYIGVTLPPLLLAPATSSAAEISCSG